MVAAAAEDNDKAPRPETAASVGSAPGPGHVIFPFEMLHISLSNAQLCFFSSPHLGRGLCRGPSAYISVGADGEVEEEEDGDDRDPDYEEELEDSHGTPFLVWLLSRPLIGPISSHLLQLAFGVPLSYL